MHRFDYIIIGAGSAGCVMANRLSTNPSNKVLLIEAGGPDSDFRIPIPGAYVDLFRTDFVWGFYSEKQKHIKNRSIYLPRGKVLGGCSSINAMAYVRGNRKDYDSWAEKGNPGWKFDNVLPYFIKSEHFDEIDQVDRDYHGTGGELCVSQSMRFQTPFSTAFLAACEETGIPFNSDYNGREQKGAGFFQFNIKKGRRHSSADAFLKPILKRENLQVLTSTRVLKIILKSDHATGVEVLSKNGRTEKIDANKEVILSAGSIQSPQILMLSGIGDSSELKKFGIKPKVNLPGVGKNLQEHLFVPVSMTSKKQIGLNHNLKNHHKLISLLNYKLRKKGALTIGPLEAVAFVNIYGDNKPANFQFHFAPFYVGEGYNYDLYDSKTLPRTDGFSICPTLVQPKSKGFIRLESDNPLNPPIIQPNLLSESEDNEQLLAGTKLALQILQQEPFDKHRKKFMNISPKSSDDEIMEHILNAVETIYHPAGTCKMGVDEMAVVDPELKVHHVEGLRVIDASIMPNVTTGNTNAPVYMIAEKGADYILSPEY